MAITVLVVDDENQFREEAVVFLTHSGYEVIGVPTMSELRKLVEQGIGDVILLDVMLPDGYGPNLLLELQENVFRPPVILITAYPNLEMAVEAMKNGAQDFLSKPVDFGRMVAAVQRAVELVEMRRELLLARQNRQAQMDFVAGKSPAMQQLLKDCSPGCGNISVSYHQWGDWNWQGSFGTLYSSIGSACKKTVCRCQ